MLEDGRKLAGGAELRFLAHGGKDIFENHKARPSGPRMQVVPENGVVFLFSRRASRASHESWITGVTTSPFDALAIRAATCSGGVKGRRPAG